MGCFLYAEIVPEQQLRQPPGPLCMHHCLISALDGDIVASRSQQFDHVYLFLAVCASVSTNATRLKTDKAKHSIEGRAVQTRKLDRPAFSPAGLPHLELHCGTGL